MRRAFSFFVLFTAAGIGAIAMGGCNAQLATVLSSDDAATQPGSGDGSFPPECPPGAFCTTEAGLDGSTSTPDGALPDAATPIGQACVTDPDCNPAPNLSSLHGQCFKGVCVCNIGTVQPNGKCGPMATDCKDQGGSCHQMPATCPTGQLTSDEATNMTCGDFVEAVCCLDPGGCKGPSENGTAIDFMCCAPNDAIRPPVCVNGWKTCPANHTPFDKTKGGCGG